MDFFRIDSKFMQFLTKAAQIMWVNLLTLFVCIPVVTAGAAFTAMNYVLLQIIRDQEGNITKSFFSSFRENFRQATAIWAGILLAGGLFAVGMVTAKNLPSAQADVYRIILLILGIVILAVVFYIFPLLSHFENTVRETVKNAMVLMILNYGKTVEMLIIWGGLYYFGIKFFERIVPVILVFNFTLPAALCLLILNPLFKSLEDRGKATADSAETEAFRVEEQAVSTAQLLYSEDGREKK